MIVLPSKINWIKNRIASTGQVPGFQVNSVRAPLYSGQDRINYPKSPTMKQHHITIGSSASKSRQYQTILSPMDNKFMPYDIRSRQIYSPEILKYGSNNQLSYLGSSSSMIMSPQNQDHTKIQENIMEMSFNSTSATPIASMLNKVIVKRRDFENNHTLQQQNTLSLYSSQNSPIKPIKVSQVELQRVPMQKNDSLTIFNDIQSRLFDRKIRLQNEQKLSQSKQLSYQEKIGNALNQTLELNQKPQFERRSMIRLSHQPKSLNLPNTLDIKSNGYTLNDSPINIDSQTMIIPRLESSMNRKSRISKLTLAQNDLHSTAQLFIHRSSFKSQGRMENPIHLIPGLDQICKLSLRGYYAPLNILFTYENQGDLKVMISQKHIEPSLTNNEGVYLNPKKIYVHGMKGSQQFANEFLYLAFTSLMGVNFKLQASFYDANTAMSKKLKNSGSNLEQTTNRKGFEMKIKQEISRCLADPSIYKEMMANIQTMGLWDDFKDQKTMHLTQMKEDMIKRAIEKRQLNEDQDREMKEQYMKRWELFKQRRDDFYKRFVDLKIRKNRVKTLVTHLMLQKMLRYLAQYYNEYKLEAVMKAVRHFRCFKIQFHMKRFFKKKGTLEGRQQALVKKQPQILKQDLLYSSLNFLAMTQHENFCILAKNTLFYDFLKETASIHHLKSQIKSFREGIIYIQRHVRIAKLLRKTKFEILLKMWNREINQLQIKSIQVKDRKNKEFIKDMNNIKEEIRDLVLNKFLDQCYNKQSMAYFQWRYAYSAKSDSEEMRIMFDCCLKKFLNISDSSPLLSKFQSEIYPVKPSQAGQSPNSPLKRPNNNSLNFQVQQIEDTWEEPTSCIVSRFDFIGLKDPLPKQNIQTDTQPQPSNQKQTSTQQQQQSQQKSSKFSNFKQDQANQQQKLAQKPKPQKIQYNFTKWVYPQSKMQNEQVPPSVIYIPDPEIVRKMIRACIKAKKPEDVLAKFQM
eukprot:403368090